jgi:purine-cytosine permease-like protein
MTDVLISGPSAPRIELRGIDHVPADERYSTPRHLAAMWSGALFNITNVVYGALVVSIGLDFTQAVVLILIAGTTWVLTGVASLPGPAAGTTAFATSRAAFGVNGNRALTACNWLMQVGYEAVDLSLATLAALALLSKAGVHAGTALKVAIVLAGALAQSLLPLLGHQSIMRVLRLLMVPFAALFLIFSVLVLNKIHLGHSHPGSWSLWFGGLALATSSSGLGWTVNGSDFSRYIPEQTSRRDIVLAVTVAGALPVVALMILGAAVATVVTSASDPISGLPHAFASWFVVPYLAFVVVQMIVVNSIDLYSSGVTIQAMGIRISRFRAVALDAVISCGVTLSVVLYGTFNTYLSDFLLFMIVWFAPWATIYCADYLLRRGRYDRDSLAGLPTGRYRRPYGLHLPGVVAQAAGSVMSLMCIYTSVFEGPICRAMGGTDLSVPAGMLVGGGLYLLLGARGVRAEGQASADSTGSSASRRSTAISSS